MGGSRKRGVKALPVIIIFSIVLLFASSANAVIKPHHTASQIMGGIMTGIVNVSSETSTCNASQSIFTSCTLHASFGGPIAGIYSPTSIAAPTIAAATSMASPSICLDGDCRTTWPSVGGTSTGGGWTNNSQNTSTMYNVGIGTTSPTQKLTISGSSGANGLRIMLNDIDIGAVQWNLVSGGTSIGGVGKFHIRDGTVGQNRLTIDSFGNVGIGTSGPEGALQITGNGFGSQAVKGIVMGMSGDYASVELKGTSAALGGGFIDFGYPSNDFAGRIVYYNGDNTMHFYAGGTDTMTIKGGNVGIGVSSPGQMLELYKDNANIAMRFHDPGDRWFTMGIDYGDGRKFKINEGGDFSSNNRITIDGNGYVGIGATDPSQRLDVNGDIRIRGKPSCGGKLYTDASGNVLCGTDATGSSYTAGTAISIAGSTISGAYTPGTGIGISGATISNTGDTSTADDITSISAGTGISVSGSGNSRTISRNALTLNCYDTSWSASSGCAVEPSATPPACLAGYTFVGISAETHSDSGCGASNVNYQKVKSRCCMIS